MLNSKSYLLNDPELFELEIKRLQIQADHLVKFEIEALKKHDLINPQSLIDLGCGNGSYLKALKTFFPSTSLSGIDRNEGLLQRFKQDLPTTPCYLGSFSNELFIKEIFQQQKPDFIISRFVFQHLTNFEQSNLLRLIKKTKKKTARLIITDTDDQKIIFVPFCEALKDMVQCKIKKQASNGGDRTIGSKLASRMRTHHFMDIRETEVIFDTEQLGWANWIDIFWPVISSTVSISESKEQKLLFQKGKKWFADALHDRNYYASFMVHQVSGI